MVETGSGSVEREELSPIDSSTRATIDVQLRTLSENYLLPWVGHRSLLRQEPETISRWWHEPGAKLSKRGNLRGHMTSATRGGKGNINHSFSRRPPAFPFSLPLLPFAILPARHFFIPYFTHTPRHMATKRRAAPRPEFSIVGDEQERHRIQLEHNLQNRDLSIDLLSSQGDYSLEYARHAERSRSPFSYPSYVHHEHSVDDQSQINPWSYRTVDDDDENGVNPYVGESLSTVAHHASAVTLNAGLGPRRGDDTRSGAEFDPERPLQNIMAGAERLSMFGNNTTSKSINNVGFFC